MIGREAPLLALRSALAEAEHGRPSVWLLAGEAGIGKTRLVAEVEAHAEGFTRLRGESVEFGGEDLPLGPVVAALRERGGLPEADTPGALFERVLERLARDAAEAPVLLVLEDLHWADRATLALLAFLARNLRGERIVVVATYRADEELRPEVRRLARELAHRRGVTRIDLGPLTAGEVHALVETLAGEAVPEAFAEDLHARAGGNPLFVRELFAARTVTLTEAVLARVERFDAELLATLAAAGGRASLALMERVAGPGGLRAALDAGLLVRDREDGVAFSHGLIGEIVYARLLPGERTALHRRIADAVRTPAERAYHCERAGMPAEALAASLEAGAQACAVFAYDTALRHYERALRLGARSPAVLAAAAQAARFAGGSERAIELCRAAIAATDDRAEQARLYERLGEYHHWDDEAALACFERGLALAPGDPALLAARGHALMGLRRWEEARAACEAGLAAGAGPRITLGVVLAHLGEPDAGEAHLRRALELAEGGEEVARTYLHLGELLRLRGDHAGALEAMDDGEREAALLGLKRSFGHFMYVNGAEDLLRLGRWEEARVRLARAGRMELTRTAAALRRATAGHLHALRGDFAAARAELDAAGDEDLPSDFVASFAAARATLALAEGDPEAARGHLAGALAGAQDPLYTPPLYSLALRAEADATETRAHALLDGLDGLIASTGRPPAPGAAAHRALAAAEHARALGVPDPARWEAAAAAFTALAEPHPAAYARVRAAEAILLAGGERRRAHEALTAAAATAAALGARPLEQLAQTLARRARLEAPAPSRDDHGLTGRELEVLALLAEALTNREIAEKLFISEKTVSTHVAHVYDKLGVHSRLAAATRAERLGLLQRPSPLAGPPPQG